MHGANGNAHRPPEDCSRTALDFVHGLLTAQADLPLDALLRDLAAAFGAVAAGLAGPPARADERLCRVGGEGRPAAPDRWPWEEEADLPDRASRARGAVSVPGFSSRTWLLTA